MNPAIFEPGVQRLIAQPHDPMLGVHELSEYTFCDRAGINTTSLQRADRGQDDNYVSPLDYQPEYEIDVIDRQLFVYSCRMLTWSIGFLVMTVLTTKLGSVHHPLALALGMIITVMLMISAISDGNQVIYWWRQRWDSIHGSKLLPDPHNPAVESLHWWQLFRAGFASVSVVDGLSDDDLRLAGQPFKLLQKGDDYVPVFLRRGDPSNLFPQHYVRMAAYCLLLRRQTGLNAPYGIILNAGTFDCLAIKFNRESFDLFSQRLLHARRIVREFRQLGKHPPTPHASLCARCPQGKPIWVESEESLVLREQSGLTPRGGIGNDGRRYHCHCGDRFDWVPPHQQTVELRIPT